jgi:hypothetical protein
MLVNLHNRDWSKGINVETAQGPDHGGGPGDNYPRQSRRLNNGESWSIRVPDGYDLWYRRDRNPDNPAIPPDFQSSWGHIVNYGNDEDRDID